MNPHEEASVFTAERTVDASQGVFKLAFQSIVRSIIVDFQDDLSGNLAVGSCAVFIGEQSGGIPYAIVRAGSLFSRPISAGTEATFVTIVPAANSKGLIYVGLSRKLLPPARF